MDRVDHDDDFVSDPVGRYRVDDDFVVWCHSDSVGGAALGRELSSTALRRLFRMSDAFFRTGSTRFQIVTDLSRLLLPEPSVFEAMMELATRQLQQMSQRVARHALIVSPDVGGATVAGVLPLVGSDHPMHVFSDGPQAFAWAFPSEDHRAIFAAVDALGVGHFERGVLQKELAVVLRKQLPNATLRSAALAMGRSPRTLQRELLAHSITFREVLEEARLVHARHLLSETDSKIEAIARAVGYSSSSGLSRAFRDAYDTTPLAWRQLSRKSE